MEVVEHRLDCKQSDSFLIYPIGDIHGGGIHCAETSIKSKVAEIRATPNAYWIGMGDIVDCITRNDKRFEDNGLAPWVERDNIVDSQREWAVELLKPIKGRCLGFLTGNHEEMIHRFHQNDISGNIARDLGVPYGGYSCFINLRFKRSELKGARLIRIHAWHGAGGSQTEGARVMRLMRLVNEFEADIYLMGHLHAKTTYSPQRVFVTTRGKKLVLKHHELIAVCTGSWLKSYNQSRDSIFKYDSANSRAEVTSPIRNERISISYAEMKGYKPSTIGCPTIKIKPFAGHTGNDVKYSVEV